MSINSLLIALLTLTVPLYGQTNTWETTSNPDDITFVGTSFISSYGDKLTIYGYLDGKTPTPRWVLHINSMSAFGLKIDELHKLYDALKKYEEWDLQATTNNYGDINKEIDAFDIQNRSIHFDFSFERKDGADYFRIIIVYLKGDYMNKTTSARFDPNNVVDISLFLLRQFYVCNHLDKYKEYKEHNQADDLK
jgi:hypothetical protein